MKKHAFNVKMQDGRSFDCCEGQSILDGMERAGIRDMVGCRRGGCGICRVKVHGGITTRPMSREHVSEAEQSRGIVLACCAYPTGDIQIETDDFSGETPR